MSDDARKRIAFLGAGAFGVPTLEALGRRFEVPLVISQPDRPAGRGRHETPTPISARILEDADGGGFAATAGITLELFLGAAPRLLPISCPVVEGTDLGRGK